LAKPFTVIVLSGGGANGAAQAAAVRVLLESGTVPDLYVATSIGSYNGGFLAANPGVEGARRLEHLWADGTMARMANPTLNHLGHALASVVRHSGLLPTPWSTIRNLGLERTDFADLATPLILGASDAEKLTPTYWGGRGASGPVGEKIVASSALAPIFDTVEIDGRAMTDWGLEDNYGLPELVDRLAADGVANADIIVVDAAPVGAHQAPTTVLRSVANVFPTILRGSRVSGIKAAEAAGHDVSVIETGGPGALSVLNFWTPARGIQHGARMAADFVRDRGLGSHETGAPEIA